MKRLSLEKMLVASFLLLASSTSLFTSTFGLTTAASREQPSTLPISSLLHLTTEAASSSQPQEVVIPYGGPMSLPSNLNGILATDPRLRRRNRRRRLRRRGRRRRSRGRRNIQMVSRPWRTTATTSSPMSLYESFGDTQNHDGEAIVEDVDQRRRLIQRLLYQRPRTTSTTTTTTSSTTTSTTTTTTSIQLTSLVTSEEVPIRDEEANVIKEGQIRLVNGRTDREGNVEIFHMGEWGSICDDEWDTYDASVLCRQLGFPGAERHTHSSQYGYGLHKIWMDNMYCVGNEKAISDCRFDGWGIHDCERTEAAGVQCKPKPPPTTPPPTTTTPRPTIEIHKSHGHALKVRLFGGRDFQEGRVEVQLDENGPWGPICGDGWGVREAMVICRELGLGFAQSGAQTNYFNSNSTTEEIMSGVSCRGNEMFLSECHHDATNWCPGTGNSEVAAVVCVDKQADLAPDLYALMSSVYLEDKHLFFLQCAMEENCLAAEAYRMRRENPNFTLETRRLLRFTTSIENIGDADFRPFIPKSAWQWHACHMHYHSMEVFAHFDIMDFQGNRIAEGHKASFCLEDNDCTGPYEAKYDCENYGDQGITPGCKDIYHANIDCQWLDVSELDTGTYIFKMAINPEFKVAEQTFENNVAVCTLIYTQQYASVSNCSYARP